MPTFIPYFETLKDADEFRKILAMYGIKVHFESTPDDVDDIPTEGTS